MDRYPTAPIDAEFRGLSRQAGERDDDGGGAQIKWGRKYDFEYEDSEGVNRHLYVNEADLDQVAGFDIQKAKKGDRFRLSGAVFVRDGWFRLEVCEPASNRVSAAA